MTPFFRTLFLGVATLSSLSVFSQKESVKPFIKKMPYDSASVPRERFVDFQHLRLEASFNPEKGQISGIVTHRFQALRKNVDTLFFDAPDIKVMEVLYESKPLQIRNWPTGITVLFPHVLNWNSVDSLSIRYEAKPRHGLYFVGWNDPTNRARKQIWTQGQGIDNRCWLPMFDDMSDKLTSEMIITMAKPYKVLSNGVKLETIDKGNSSIWHYRMNKPHAPYLIMLGIGDYDIETRKTQSGLTTNLWYYPDWKSRVALTYAKSTEMIDFFEQEIGIPFPWENYSQIPVQEFMYGAMENTTATVFGDFFFNDERGNLDRSYIGVNAHELAHQWFGDMVTARSETHHWLQESFATHYNMMYEREAFGQDYFDKARRNGQNAAFNASSKDLFQIASSKAGSTRWYPKGAVVLEMLKYVVGREEFNRSIKHYLESHPYSNVDTEDLLVAFHETLGYSLDWFWDQWIYRGGEPIYQVKTTSNETQTTFDVTQLQENLPYVGLFKMPIVFELHFSDGTSVNKTVWISEKQTQVTLDHPAGKKLAYPLFDPGNQVIKGSEFEKSFEYLKAQALTAKHMLDRLDAIEALLETASDKKRELLHQVYKQETFYAVKEAIIDQLAKDEHKKSRALLNSATKDSDVQVRKALISAFDTIPEFLKKSVELMLNERSYQLQEEVLYKLCLSFPKEINTYLDLTKTEQGNNSHNVRLAWLKWKIKQGDASVKNELFDFASVSFDFNTRRTALYLAKENQLIDESMLLNALNAAQSANSRLSNSGVSYLNWAYNLSDDYRFQIDKLLNKNLSEKWEQEMNVKIQKVNTK